MNIHPQIPTPNLQTYHHLHSSFLREIGVPVCLMFLFLPRNNPGFHLFLHLFISYPLAPSSLHITHAQVTPNKHKRKQQIPLSVCTTSFLSGFLKMIYLYLLLPLWPLTHLSHGVCWGRPDTMDAKCKTPHTQDPNPSWHSLHGAGHPNRELRCTRSITDLSFLLSVYFTFGCAGSLFLCTDFL